jgi:hypothetical protein
MLLLQEYIYIINKYINSIISNDKNNINHSINNQIHEIKNTINELMGIVRKNIQIEDLCTYISNSNANELTNVLYLLVSLYTNYNITIPYNLYKAISTKLTNSNIYLKNLDIYNYEGLFNNSNSNKTLGLNSEFVKQTDFVKHTPNEYTKLKNNATPIKMKNVKTSELIDDFLNSYFDNLNLITKPYNIIGKSNDTSTIEIMLYNMGIKKTTRFGIEQAEISIFETLKI